MQTCEEWLRDFLKERGPVHYAIVKEKAKERGFTRGQLKSARKALKVETINDWALSGETLNWYWQLPSSEA